MERIEREFLAKQGCSALRWRLLLTADEIQAAVRGLASTINKLYREPQAKPLVLVGILKGVYVFLADLSKHLTVPYSVYFLEASSYSGQQQGAVRFASHIEPSKLQGRQVLLLDELFDSGRTMAAMRQALLDHAELELSADDVRTCTLFSKAASSAAAPQLVGIPNMPPLWLVGYGLDDQGEKRGWPHLFACPKAEGVPPASEDAIFQDAAVYQQVRQRLLESLGLQAQDLVAYEQFLGLLQHAKQHGLSQFAMGYPQPRGIERLVRGLHRLLPAEEAARIDYNIHHVFYDAQG